MQAHSIGGTSGQIGEREENRSGESSPSRKETQRPVIKGSHQRTPFLCCYRELWEMVGGEGIWFHVLTTTMLCAPFPLITKTCYVEE